MVSMLKNDDNHGGEMEDREGQGKCPIQPSGALASMPCGTFKFVPTHYHLVPVICKIYAVGIEKK